MSRRRIFVPVGVARLAELLDAASPPGGGGAGRVSAAGAVVVVAGDAVHAVTPGLRADFPDADDEELEYLAMTAAAQASVTEVADDGPFRRLVLALDAVLDGTEGPAAATVAAATGAVAPDEDPTVVHVAEERLLGHVVAAHLDGPGATEVVRRAVEELRRGSREVGDEAGGGAVLLERCLDHELGWYAASELRDVPVEARAGMDRPR